MPFIERKVHKNIRGKEVIASFDGGEVEGTVVSNYRRSFEDKSKKLVLDTGDGTVTIENQQGSLQILVKAGPLADRVAKLPAATVFEVHYDSVLSGDRDAVSGEFIALGSTVFSKATGRNLSAVEFASFGENSLIKVLQRPTP